MSSGDEEKGRGFTVVDRRGSESEDESPPPSAADEAPPQPAADVLSELPAIDFSTFVLSLGTSALYHMGLVEEPESGGRPASNLPLARQTIDTLAMLEEKTRGNLEVEEARLLESLLYELRMRFVETGK